MSHPFPFMPAPGIQQVPSFLERSRLSMEEIRKDPFKLTRQRSRLKAAKQEERINSASTVSLDVSKCRNIHHSLKKIGEALGWKVWMTPRKLGISDIYWQAHQIENYTPYYRGGAINKFPQMAEILRKINLTRALSNMRMLFPEEYDFYPKTWFLPQQFHEFCADVAYERRNQKGKAKKKPFIVKPDGGTQGEGIYLIKEPQDYTFTPNMTHAVQEYITNPLLIEHTKFDLRIYAILLSLNPVSIYMSQEGLARFCTVQYKEPTNKNMHEPYMHLTNYSLNKFSEKYIHTDRLTDGSKRTATSVLTQIERSGQDADAVWADIEQVVIKTLLAVLPEIQIASSHAIKSDNRVRCFQILGFDILLTDSLKPILLEVNANPSLSMTFDKELSPGIYEEIPSAVDKYVKYKMIKEVLLLAAPRDKVAHHRMPTKPVKIPEEELTGYECLYEEETEPEHFLYEIYPDGYSEDFNKLRILERVAALYQASLGIHESQLSANSFRMFARKCRLNHQNNSLTVAALDILFIEIQRRWADCQSTSQPGLSFQAFLEAFMTIARRSKLKSHDTHEMVDNLLHYCEANLENVNKNRLRRAKLPKIPVRYVERKRDGSARTEASARHTRVNNQE
ncbi:tubulin polyglutamylase TTLL11-like [Watersipora subatra]|uniref:tubulin polyglutamylase TTLL11-like n=1 Tax=Watersipora subatra TaxID=2589382 RepID=UPI00355B8621